MKFKCGPSLADRYDSRQKRIKHWHRWFAWRPVRITEWVDDGTAPCVWLEFIWRRESPHSQWPECCRLWEFRLWP